MMCLVDAWMFDFPRVMREILRRMSGHGVARAVFDRSLMDTPVEFDACEALLGYFD